MPIIEITPAETIMFLADKSVNDDFVCTHDELCEFGHYVEKQKSSYRCEGFSNFDSLNYLLGMKNWAPMMFKITYQGKEDRWEWDVIKIHKTHHLYDYMRNRYMPPNKELEYFEKAYVQYIENK